ncbi:permease prefix domain 1-containing protein [Agromyces seonyuensis]|uniref:DUF4153 domain-containing protein n=1 Tax=Agromyces seonyuensis TaxID=2662446 RepID=A0A6I4P0H0_9MICO|nr:hypothetical protein [Agromyces seonyuensis]
MTGSHAALEARIAEWRGYVGKRPAVAGTDVDELESHLRDRIEALQAGGLDDDEAFLVAVKRMGALDAVSREFAVEHSERLWKQLVLHDADAPGADGAGRGRTLPAIAAATAAALAVALVTALGLGLDSAADPTFLIRNFALLVLPCLSGYFAWRGRVRPGILVVPALGMLAAAVILNLPVVTDDDTLLGLVALHVPVVLWLLVGVVFANGDWRSGRARMDYLRFTGEWLVYLVLLVLGGGALVLLTGGVFGAIGLDASEALLQWVVPSGGAAAIVVAAWLVEAKQSVIENIAPVLTKVFTPLMTTMLAALVVAAIASGNPLESERELLALFDAVLIVVLALLLYAFSAREPLAPAGWFDRLQLGMVVLALMVDVFVLVAMVGRIGVWGASPLKIASLGLNLLLAVNLARSAWLQLRFVRGRAGFAALEDWQTAYLPAYAAWAALVAIAFPVVFG